MPTDVDHQIAHSSALLDRVSDDYRRGAARRRREGEVGRRLTRIAIADAVILVAAVVIGLLTPLGLLGAVGVVTLMIAVTLALALLPASAAPTPERLRETPLKALPDRTARWLDTQRPALPAPAITLVDQISQRLDVLGPQLATLDEREPAAAELRKLMGEQLPDFLNGYGRVPRDLRSQPRNGKTPDAELVDGLTVIARELGEMSRELAQGDLDGLATRGRFLEIKYSGEGAA